MRMDKASLYKLVLKNMWENPAIRGRMQLPQVAQVSSNQTTDACLICCEQTNEQQWILGV